MLHKNENTLNDDSLFEKIRIGDMDAFKIMFSKYYPILCAYANHFVSMEDGQEIVQDVMVWFWENSGMHVIESSPRNYLFKAVKNKCLTLINRNALKEQIIQSISERMEKPYDDPDFYVVEELTRSIEIALSHLPDNFRQVFEMNRFQNMTYKEIAQQLEISPKTVDYRIQQCLKQLRIELKDYLPLITFWI